MSYLAPVRVRVEKDVVIRIRRTLRSKGQLNVREGQQLAPEEIIGSCQISSGFRTFNLSQALSVPAKDVEKYLKRKIGERIYKDELLAFKEGGFFAKKKVVISPTDGVLDFFNNKTGEVRLTSLPKKEDLLSGVYGIVEEVNKEKGQVIIRTQVSRIHGTFGSGRSRDGLLHILGKKGELVTSSMIDPKYDQYILLGGNLFFKDAISASISVGVNGIIMGGINAKDYKAMVGGRLIFPKKLDNDIGISIVILEGFGSIAVGDDIFAVLSEYEGRFISIDGNKALINLPSVTSASIAKVKNTKLQPIQNDDLFWDDGHKSEILDLKVGVRVRVIGNSFLGEQGKIVALDKQETLMPSKLKAILATIETTRRKIQVPVANLEVIL